MLVFLCGVIFCWYILALCCLIFVYTRFFYKQCFFSSQPQCCSTFSWIELQMLLRCYLTHISILILSLTLYLLYLRPCLGLGLFMSYVSIYVSFSVSFSLSLIIWLHLNRSICFLYMFQNRNRKSSASGCCLTFVLYFANFSLALLLKVLVLKESVQLYMRSVVPKEFIKT